MAFEKLNALYYLADTKEDLKEILKYNSRMGLECYVIKEACEYKLMSTGEWIKQIPVSTSVSGGDIDLSDYATEQYVDLKIAEIEIPDLTGYATEEFVSGQIAALNIPSIEGLAQVEYVDDKVAEILKNPVFNMMSGDKAPTGHMLGLYIEAKDNKSLIDVMMEKGLGMYNFWIEKGAPGQPAEVVAKNSSCRGLCCYDTANGTGGKYGWILMIDQDGDVYSQYIRNGVAKGWKNLTSADNSTSTTEVVEKLEKKILACYRPIKYDISHVPKGTIVDYDRRKEIRVFCPKSVKFERQSVGSTGNPNMYYMAFKAYAPEGAETFKEGDQGIIKDEVFDFNGKFAGIDEYGRKYSICWLALASYSMTTGQWTYFGANSTDEKFIGWSYIVEWYDKDGVMIDTDMIRINLSNEDCHFESSAALWNIL